MGGRNLGSRLVGMTQRDYMEEALNSFGGSCYLSHGQILQMILSGRATETPNRGKSLVKIVRN